jgi:hypothetical protein
MIIRVVVIAGITTLTHVAREVLELMRSLLGTIKFERALIFQVLGRAADSWYISRAGELSCTQYGVTHMSFFLSD